jgi:sigma-B regulation protein RsbU (phosphoserine phosphatase)
LHFSKQITLRRVFIALLAVDVALQWAGVARGLALLITFALIVIALILGVRLVRKAIWGLRNRLIVTYVFIAVVPIALILALAAIGTWIVAGQVAVYLVSSELERRAASLQNPARFLIRAKENSRAALIEQLAPLLRDQLPEFEILVTGNQTVRYPAENKLDPPPAGFGDSIRYVLKDGRYYCVSVARNGDSQALILAPIDTGLLSKLVPGIGLLGLYGDAETNVRGKRAGIAGRVPPRYNALDFQFPWWTPIPVALWKRPAESQTALLVVQTRPSAVLNAVFGNTVEFAQNTLVTFAVIASLLLVVELLSFVIGVSLARTITGAVHGLYEGTLRIATGDFGYRIPVKGNDQLAELAKSFNNMTEQLENLVAVAKEKERLQSEIEIASEVQTQLFPRSAPSLRTIELIGFCQPARMVSGDYYDYLPLPDGNLALAIGDVAGKGISAALLMASIQSIVRTQISAGLPVAAIAGNGHGRALFSTSTVVAQLNRQLYANTSPEKYATFFFGAYDEDSHLLTYTNAGHLPPMLLRNGDANLLEVTGTVVGAFPSIRYEEQVVEMRPGDLLVAYTDGITEPENAYGEEFGTARLAEIAMRYQHADLKEIAARIMEGVAHWSAAAELPDDMTVVIARGRA